MKKLNLIHQLSLKALKARAIKAAASVAISSKKDTPKSTKVKTKKKPSIEREIRSIFHALSSKAEKNQIVIIEQPIKGASRKATISIYNRDDLSKQRRPLPITMYAFYSHTFDDEKLGSVAIYGSDVSIQRNLILRNGFLFGHRVISANLEMGRRLFIDVQLAA